MCARQSLPAILAISRTQVLATGYGEEIGPLALTSTGRRHRLLAPSGADEKAAHDRKLRDERSHGMCAK